jgi:hypothetical protein
LRCPSRHFRTGYVPWSSSALKGARIFFERSQHSHDRTVRWRSTDSKWDLLTTRRRNSRCFGVRTVRAGVSSHLSTCDRVAGSRHRRGPGRAGCQMPLVGPVAKQRPASPLIARSVGHRRTNPTLTADDRRSRSNLFKRSQYESTSVEIGPLPSADCQTARAALIREVHHHDFTNDAFGLCTLRQRNGH